MSIFGNISFMNEGEQAEEYKARKAKEAEDKKKAEEERNKRRYGDPLNPPGDKYRNSEDGAKKHEDLSREIQAGCINDREERFRHYDDDRDRDAYFRAMDKARGKYAASEQEKDAYEKAKAAYDVTSKNAYNYFKNKDYAKDATNRHIRRHPEQYKECGIFESVQFLNEFGIQYSKNPPKNFVDFGEKLLDKLYTKLKDCTTNSKRSSTLEDDGFEEFVKELKEKLSKNPKKGFRLDLMSDNTKDFRNICDAFKTVLKSEFNEYSKKQSKWLVNNKSYYYTEFDDVLFIVFYNEPDLDEFGFGVEIEYKCIENTEKNKSKIGIN